MHIATVRCVIKECVQINSAPINTPEDLCSIFNVDYTKGCCPFVGTVHFNRNKIISSTSFYGEERNVLASYFFNLLVGRVLILKLLPLPIRKNFVSVLAGFLSGGRWGR